MGALYRLSRASIGFGLVLTTAAAAQTPPTFTIDTKLQCGVPEVMFQESIAMGEDALFGGDTVVLGPDGQPYWTEMLFTVNQETGLWTLFTFYGENIACLTASGAGFTPF
jgi:hypothetical protein